MIWEASMTPRLVVITPKPDGFPWPWEAPRSSPGILLPVFFSVSKESRHCALRHYVWKFTISIMSRSSRIGNPAYRRITTQEARVVMSPSDTLGFLGWKFQTRFGHTLYICVDSSNETSPWEVLSTRHSTQPGVKSIALLDHDPSDNHRIVSDPNSTPSLDVDSVLHNLGSTALWVGDQPLQPKSAKARSLNSLYPWYDPTYSEHKLSMRPYTFLGSLWEWGNYLWPRIRCRRLGSLNEKVGSDIVSFELFEMAEETIGLDGENSQVS